ncbi:isopentenyl-diphosphate delta-isomerase [Thioclava sp. SK-1]|uniref:isopentenyl-diphosphate Delta-isomerase n=1 Tax=Thioclava sp. SK-1 TaxID=1889770 RepID=UPI000826BA90|nr:isopentenyl-diphosphate Delta-isomerase [Thioclava sp. SK-1]OCX61659.1 isopentenyl-diphosphate delta-isomerase [Thioclava sp. SK-1]
MDTLIPAWIGDDLHPVDKLAAHQRGLRHKAVSVFVMDGSKTLIQQRAAQKYHSPNLWANTCCTHPYWGETPLDCAKRRLRQELGITGLTPRHRDRLEYRADVGNGLIEHEVVDIYLAQANSDLSIAPDPAEVSQTRWIELADLQREVTHAPERFSKWIAVYMGAPAQQIFGTMMCPMT